MDVHVHGTTTNHENLHVLHDLHGGQTMKSMKIMKNNK